MILGYTNFQSGKIIVALTKEAGLFTKHGIDLDLVQLRVGEDPAQKLLSGSIGLFLGNSYPIVKAVVTQAAKLAIIASLGSVSFKLAARSSITSPQALKGGRVGVGGSGSTIDRLTCASLAALGLEPERDVQLVATGLHDSQKRLELVLKGEVDATLVGSEHTNDLRSRKQQLCVLADLEEQGIYVSGSDITASRDLLATERSAVKRFLAALLEGIVLAKNDMKMVREMYRRYAAINDANVLDWLVEEYVQKRIPLEPFPRAESIGAELQEKFPEVATDPGTLMDVSLMTELTTESPSFYSRRKIPWPS